MLTATIKIFDVGEPFDLNNRPQAASYDHIVL
jgi:hypothetical protein